MKQKKHIITLLVNNQPGVLIRIALVFAKRGYNIDSLVTHPTHERRFSVISVAATGEEKTLRQILKQLDTIVDVIHATDRSDDPCIQLELSLIKLKFDAEKKAEILNVCTALKCDIVDISDTSISISAVGTENHLDSIEEIVEVYGIIEIIRTGTVLMVRGAGLTT